MTRVETVEKEVETLSPEELTEFRHWFAAYDAEAWDRQFEHAASSGKLDALADAALAAHRP